MSTKSELIFDNLENMDNILVFVGASGSGKSTLVEHIRKNLGIPQLVTTTTRHKRRNEKEGEDYHFIESEEFNRLADNESFLETTSYSGNLYGLTKEEIDKNSNNVSTVITDINGARTLANLYPDRVMVFWMKSTPLNLVKRLRKRGESWFTIITRLFNAYHCGEFTVPTSKFVDVNFTVIHSEDDMVNNFGIVYYKLLTDEFKKNTDYLQKLEKEKELNNGRKTLL
jgi:guanylate kinase|nr:MAG TPA: guanylate kinase [Caudoviricetes sp.]